MAKDFQKQASMETEEKNQDFLLGIQAELQDFIASQDDKLYLPPMNAYFRRLSHQLASCYGLDSNSEGKDERRHLVISKTANTVAADFEVKFNIKNQTPRRFDKKNRRNGEKNDFKHSPRTQDREFLVPISDSGVEVILTKDGFVGFRNAQPDSDIQDCKIIKSGSFKILDNKIVET